jgi:hypothetical protein
VRCPECATENPPDYRFCGMCGTPLAKSEPVSAAAGHAAAGRSSHAPSRPSPPPTSLSGPSFLGLSGDGSADGGTRSSRDLDYLFEDEQPKRTYWRFALLVVILAVIGGLGWLQYKRSGKAWVAPWSSEVSKTPVEASQPAANAPSPTPASPQAVPPASQPAAQATQTPAETAGPSEKDIPPSEASTSPAKSATEKTAESQDQESEVEASKTEKTPTAEPDQTDNSAAETKPAKFATPPAKAKPAPPKPVVSEDDALVANAEKYLYGRGVPQNCDRALSSLRAAAQRQNSRARSLLGSMYATGHCVPRDLPSAYRWFALASRDNTDNLWVQRNLEMIWREMTPQERQLATQRAQ